MIDIIKQYFRRFGYGFAQTPSFPLLGGRNKTEPYKI